MAAVTEDPGQEKVDHGLGLQVRRLVRCRR